MSMPKLLFVFAVVLSFSVAAFGQQVPEPDWHAWQFLKGKWVGEGSAEVGQGAGYCTFEPDLQNKAWIRRNHSEYPETKQRPKYVHDDIMVVYFDSATRQTRAFYYDTEGHAIQYTAAFSADDKTLTFLGDKQDGMPRFRLKYIRTTADQMALTLEVAQPSAPGDFHKIVEGELRKVSQ